MTPQEIKTEKLLNRLEQVKELREAISFSLPSKHFKIINNSIHELIDDIIEESKELDAPFVVLEKCNNILDIKIKKKC